MKKIESLGRTTTQSVEKHTGKDWDYWIGVLEKSRAENLNHKEIVSLLKTKFKLKPWWQQIVATGFEVHTGKKKEGQNAKGEYSVTVTKTINVSHKKLWKFLFSPIGLQCWLKPMSDFYAQKGETFEVNGGVFGEVRTIKPLNNIRLRWEDGDWPKKTVLQVHLVPRPKDKSILVFTHEQLANPRIREKQRAYWKQAADEIVSVLKNYELP